MERVTPEQVAERDRLAAEKKAKHDAEGTVSDERLKELKEKARADIDARLLARRKQRRLLRGGDLPGTHERSR
jgi:hypothetical protein